MKNFGEKEAWTYPGTAQIFWYPYYLMNGKSYGFQIWSVHSERPSEQKPIKNFGNKVERGRIQGLPNVFECPLLSQERVKLRTSNFACTFMGSIGTKAH